MATQSDAAKTSSAEEGYKPFPSFLAWQKQTEDYSSIQAVEEIVSLLKSQPAELQQRALDGVRNVAAIETGAIEDLYPSDRGLTITAATGVAILDAINLSHGETVRAYVAAAIDAYQYVLDFSTRRQPIAATWIRELHCAICRSQATYRALVGDHYEERELPKGEYKSLPNHVLTKDGRIHYHAPPVDTVGEVNRLIEEITSQAFDSAHPLDQASYAHFAFVAVHPFIDGNGRVARALASLFTYRAYSLPLLIFAVQRDNYLDALRNADSGNYRPFKQFIASSSCTTGIL
jgi:Fic family protein